jgi:hypothetical protein
MTFQIIWQESGPFLEDLNTAFTQTKAVAICPAFTSSRAVAAASSRVHVWPEYSSG